MKKKKRVSSKTDFQQVISCKQKSVSSSYVVYYLKRDDQKEARYGISAGTRLGGAVQRVRIRRQVRAMIDDIDCPDILPRDYVIIVRNGFLNHSYWENLDDLKKIMTKIGGLNRENQ